MSKRNYFLFKEDIDHIVRDLNCKYDINIISKEIKNGEYNDGTPRTYTMYELDGHDIMTLDDCNRQRGVSAVAFSKHCYPNDDEYRKLDEYLRPKSQNDLKDSKLFKTDDGMYGIKTNDENEIKYYLNQIKLSLTAAIQNITLDFSNYEIIYFD